MSNYIANEGESITDIILNATGSLSNWDTILTANGMLDWTPILTPGQVIIIPSTVNVDNNTLQQLQQYPICNSVRQDILDQISDVWAVIMNYWILTTGFWNDSAAWIDTDLWID